ncbi:efflux RND transporter periplasmic adaptor subunit [Pseudomonas pergaminensis]
MHVHKRPTAAILALAIVAGTAAALNHHVNGIIPTAQAEVSINIGQEVDVAPVTVQKVSDFQSYSGRFEAVEKVDVKSQVTGTIVAVHFKDGAMVKKGDALFTIDPQPFEASLSKANAELAAAQARQAYASSDWARAQRLLPSGAIAKRDYEQKNNDSKKSEADVKAAKAAVDSAKINLAYTQIKSPITGRVSRAEITIGNTVFLGSGAPALTTVVSVSPIYAAFDVDEQSYLRYLGHPSKSGLDVALGLADETGYSRKAVIDSIDNQMDVGSGTIRVRARLDNSDGFLVPGLYARVRVSSGTPHDAVLVDDAAVGTDQAKKFVWVINENDKVEYRDVQLGALHNGMREITEGLQAGDRIVINGLQRVRPGDSVKVKSVQMAGAIAAPLNAS